MLSIILMSLYNLYKVIHLRNCSLICEIQPFLSVSIWSYINLEREVINGDIDCGTGGFLSCENSTKHLQMRWVVTLQDSILNLVHKRFRLHQYLDKSYLKRRATFLP